MAHLIFYDDGHVYEVDGERLPSVSEILRFISREEYGDISQYTLDNAGERGKAVHKATENIDRYGNAEIDDQYLGYIQAYVRFRKEHEVEWRDIEKSMYHPQKKYAGTIDRFGLVDGTSALVDIKTNAAIKKTLTKAQLNGYEDMRGANGEPPADAMYCLQLMKDGKYRLYPCKRDSSEFDACYMLHTRMTQRQERGEIV